MPKSIIDKSQIKRDQRHDKSVTKTEVVLWIIFYIIFIYSWYFINNFIYICKK